MVWPIVAAAAIGAAGSYLGSKATGSKPALHGWQERAAKRYTHGAADVASLPYHYYGGTPWADPNATLEAGWGRGPGMHTMSGNMLDQGAGGYGDAMDWMSQIQGSPNWGTTGDIFNRVGSFSPDQVGADQVTVDPLTGQPISVNPLTGEQITGAAQEFFNPYEDEVIGNYMSDMNRSREISQTNRSDQYGSIGALGGSSHQLADAATNEAFAREVGSTSAQLRKYGYDTAIENATRMLEGNRVMDYQQQVFNSDDAFRVGATNQDAMMRAALANQGTNLQADMFNVDSDMSAQNLNMAGAQSLMQMLGMQGDLASTQAGIATQSGNMGINLGNTAMNWGQIEQEYLDRGPAFEYEQWLGEQEHPYRQLGVLSGAANSALGGGAAFQRQPTRNPYISALSGGMGAALQAYSMMPNNPSGGGKGYNAGVGGQYQMPNIYNQNSPYPGKYGR